MDDKTSEVVIFRHHLFKVSEPFIFQQAAGLTRYKPIFVGRDRFGATPEGYESLSLSDSHRRASLQTTKLWQVLTGDIGGYLEKLSGRDPKLIHAHFGVEGVYALPLARALNVPLITTFHGFDATTRRMSLSQYRSPAWLRYLSGRQSLATEGDVFICVSKYIKEKVLSLGFSPRRTLVHYIGIDSRNIKVRALSEERPVILHVARLVEKKGTEFLIKAFGKVTSEFPEFELQIIGDGPLLDRLKDVAKAFNISSKIKFLGAMPHSEVISRMRTASLLVLPSITARSGDAEGLGMVLLEAAALGIPLLGTNHGGIPEVIEEGVTGYLVPERDSDAIADRLRTFMANPSLRESMGLRARAHIEATFDLETQSRRLEEIYSNAIEARQ